MTTWTAIEEVVTQRWSGRCTARRGASRDYRVPSPTGGTILVEVTLRPRWCSLTVDRWRSTDRDPGIARPWLEANVWPAVCRAHDTKGTGFGTLPSGDATITGAYPIARADLLDVLTAWIDAELTWGHQPRLRRTRAGDDTEGRTPA